MKCPCSVLLLVVVSCPALLPAQQTWRVNALGGLGVDFTDLPPAVAAAAPGDTILVYGDQSQPLLYTAPTVDKPLSIVGFDTQPAGSATAVPLRIDGVLTVTNIGAGQHVIVSNLEFYSANYTTCGYVLSNCQGEVVLDSCRTQYNSIHEVNNCSQVVIRRCQFTIATCLHVVDSRLLLSSSSIPASNYAGFIPRTLALDMERSDVTLVNSTISGFYSEAVRIADGTLWIGSQSAIHGGVYYAYFDPWSYTYYYSYCLDYELVEGTNSHVIADTRIVGTSGYVISARGLPVSPDYPAVADLHACYSNKIQQEAYYAVLISGPPGGFALLAAGLALPSPIVTPFGFLAIEPASLLVAGIYHCDPLHGMATSSTFYCDPAIPLDQIFTFQAAVLDANGTISLTLDSPFAIQLSQHWHP
jgi:hypothetical protein